MGIGRLHRGHLVGGLLFDLLGAPNLIWLIFAGNCAIAAAALWLVLAAAR